VSTALLFTKTTRCVQRPRPPQLFGEPIQWVEAARYLEVTLDTQLAWSAHINQVRKKAAQRLGLLSPPSQQEEWPVHQKWRTALQAAYPSHDEIRMPYPAVRCQHTHINKLQVLQSKCLRIATNAPWYVGNKQIHKDLRIPFFADPIRALTESFESKLADAGNPLVRQLGRHLFQPRAD
jgi:hypothetical protein